MRLVHLAVAAVAALPYLYAQPAPVKIGVVLPEAAAAVAAPVRAELLKYLAGPAVEVVTLDARASSQIEAEAAAKGVTHILSSKVVQKAAAQSGKRGFLKGATSMANMVPMIGMAHGMSGMIAATAAGSAMSGIAEATQQVKAKDEWTLAYKLAPVGGAAPVLDSTAHVQAASNGQDVFSPMMHEAAEAVLATLTTKVQ